MGIKRNCDLIISINLHLNSDHLYVLFSDDLQLMLHNAGLLCVRNCGWGCESDPLKYILYIPNLIGLFHSKLMRGIADAIY